MAIGASLATRLQESCRQGHQSLNKVWLQEIGNKLSNQAAGISVGKGFFEQGVTTGDWEQA